MDVRIQGLGGEVVGGMNGEGVMREGRRDREGSEGRNGKVGGRGGMGQVGSCALRGSLKRMERVGREGGKS